MSKQTKTMAAVSTSFQFASQKVVENILEYIRRENIEMSDVHLRQLKSLVESSVNQALNLTSSSIEKTL